MYKQYLLNRICHYSITISRTMNILNQPSSATYVRESFPLSLHQTTAAFSFTVRSKR